MGTKLTQVKAKRGAESRSDNKKRECLSGDVFVEITRSLYSLKMAVNIDFEESQDRTLSPAIAAVRDIFQMPHPITPKLAPNANSLHAVTDRCAAERSIGWLAIHILTITLIVRPDCELNRKESKFER